MSDDDHGWYAGVGGVVGVLTFIVSWIYCIATYGFLLGVGLGWLPSIIVAVLAALLWPVIAIVIGLVLLLIFR